MPRGDFFIPCCDREEFIQAFAASHALPGAATAALQHNIVCRSSTGYTCEPQVALSEAAKDGVLTAAQVTSGAGPSPPVLSATRQKTASDGTDPAPTSVQEPQGSAPAPCGDAASLDAGVQATLAVVQAPARAFLPIKNNRQALPPFAVQVRLRLADVQKQRQWGSTEVRAYVLTEADVNIVLLQHHLPLWLQRRILGAAPVGGANAAQRVLDANAEPFQHMAGCDRASVDIDIATTAAASQLDDEDAPLAGGGCARATFADVDKAGKVRNALKFKYPTKQNRVYIVFAAVVGPDRDIVIALLSQPSLVISRGEQRLQATEKLSSLPAAAARGLWQEINDSILNTGGALYQLIDRPVGRSGSSRTSRRRSVGGAGRSASAPRKCAPKRRSASAGSGSDSDGSAAAAPQASDDSNAADRAEAWHGDAAPAQFYMPVDAALVPALPPDDAAEELLARDADRPFGPARNDVCWGPAQHAMHDGAPPAGPLPWAHPNGHMHGGMLKSCAVSCDGGDGDGSPLTAWQHVQWQRQLSMQSVTAHSDSVKGGTGDLGSMQVFGSGSSGRIQAGAPVGGTAPLPLPQASGGGEAGLRGARSLPPPSRHTSRSGSGRTYERKDSSSAYEGRSERAQHDPAADAAAEEQPPAEEPPTGSESLGASDGAEDDAGAGRGTRKAQHAQHAGQGVSLDPTKQLVDPGSHRLFFFPEKPRPRSPQPPGGKGASDGTHGADRGSGGVPPERPVSGSATSGGDGDGGLPRGARNLMDLVHAGGAVPVDAARAAAAGAMAQQPMGARHARAAVCGGSGDAAAACGDEAPPELVQAGSFGTGPQEIALQPPDDSTMHGEGGGKTGSIAEMWRRSTSQQSLPQRLGGSAARESAAGDLLTEGSGETHPAARRAAAQRAADTAQHGEEPGRRAHGVNGTPPATSFDAGSSRDVRQPLPHPVHAYTHVYAGGGVPQQSGGGAYGQERYGGGSAGVNGHEECGLSAEGSWRTPSGGEGQHAWEHGGDAYQQQMVNLHHVFDGRSGQHMRRESWEAQSRTLEAAGHRCMHEAPARTHTASPHSRNSSIALPAASPQPRRPNATSTIVGTPFNARGVGDVSEASGRSAMHARRMSMSLSSGMPDNSTPSGGISTDMHHSTRTGSTEQLSRGGPPCSIPRSTVDAVWHWHPDGYSGEWFVPGGRGGAMPPRKVARPPPPTFSQDSRFRLGAAMHGARSTATVPHDMGSMQAPGSHQSSRELRRAVTVSGSHGVMLMHAGRAAHTAEWQRQHTLDPIWRMESGEVPLAGPEDTGERGVFQQWRSTPAGGGPSARALGFEYLHLQPRELGCAPGAHNMVTLRPHHSMQLHSLHGGSSGCAAGPGQVSGSEPVMTTTTLPMHVSDTSSVGMAVREGGPIPMDDTARNWMGAQRMCAPHGRNDMMARSAPVAGVQPPQLAGPQEALLQHMVAEQDINADMLMRADSLDWADFMDD
eukprot:jgi/Ulvmu1/12331/UM089_0015.1